MLSSSETLTQLVHDLHALGVRRGGVLLVHSSLSALGHVPGGAETVIQALLDTLGPKGTLLMPSLTYERVNSKNPVFDVRHTRSNVGVIPETFRTRPGTRRSLHPTHSVCAIGPHTVELLGYHLRDSTPCGPNSPFRKLRDVGGQLLMLGCGLCPNTSMHAIEELVEPPYLYDTPRVYQIRDASARVLEKVYRPHSFQEHDQRYDRLADVLHVPDLRAGPVLEGTAHRINVPAMWEAVLAKLREDPLYFVDYVGPLEDF